jgi:hypothetical protein
MHIEPALQHALAPNLVRTPWPIRRRRNRCANSMPPPESAFLVQTMTYVTCKLKRDRETFDPKWEARLGLAVLRFVVAVGILRLRGSRATLSRFAQHERGNSLFVGDLH